jgi:hypothetical protein
MWHCPSCGAPQAESARCWVCHRSSTTCSTCSHFRTSLSAEVGWCALDPKRRPLTGLEQRGCWQERPAGAAEPAALAGPPDAARRLRLQVDEPPNAQPARRLDFIPVELVAPKARPASPPATGGAAVDAAGQTARAPILADIDDGWAERTSLFGELEA